MKKRCFAAVCAVFIAAAVLEAQTEGEARASYYVSASGNDRNNGLSETWAFKSLAHAVSQAARSDTIKTVTVIGTLNRASEGGLSDMVFLLVNEINEAGDNTGPVLITGLPNASAGRRAVLSAAGTTGDCVRAYGVLRFEHIEISDSRETGLIAGLESDVTLGPGSLIRDNEWSGVVVSAVFAHPDASPENISGPGALTLDGGIVENNWGYRGGGGIFVSGAFTMKRGSVRNNQAVSDNGEGSMGGGIYIASNEPVSIEGGDISGNKADMGGGLYIAGGRVTLTGGVITGNTADEKGGGVWICTGASFTSSGGTVNGNRSGSSAYRDIGQENEWGPDPAHLWAYNRLR
jgi:hypothetical protein